MNCFAVIDMEGGNSYHPIFFLKENSNDLVSFLINTDLGRVKCLRFNNIAMHSVFHSGISIRDTKNLLEESGFSFDEQPIWNSSSFGFVTSFYLLINSIDDVYLLRESIPEIDIPSSELDSARAQLSSNGFSCMYMLYNHRVTFLTGGVSGSQPMDLNDYIRTVKHINKCCSLYTRPL